MEYKIKTLNAISSAIYTQLDDKYKVADDVANPQGVLVRSASMHDAPIDDSVLCIARAGAGYNNIPITLLRGDTTCGGYNAVQRVENTVGEVCRAMGYDEIITYSFISPTYYDKIRWAADDARRDSLKILNPLAPPLKDAK